MLIRHRLLNSGMLRGLRSLRNDATGLAEIRTSIADLVKAENDRETRIKAMIEKAQKDIEATGSISTELKNQLAAMAEKGTEGTKRIETLEQLVAQLKNADRTLGAIKTAGQKFVADDKVKAALAEGQSFKGRVRAVVQNIITELDSGSGGAGDLIVPQRLQGIITPQNRRLRIRDLLMKGRTVSNAIEFVQEAGFTNAAAPVAEGATKPESTLSFELLSAPVRTIAHWVRASKQVLDDVPQLQSYIDTRLRYGLALVEEAQLLAGDGSGQNILGLIPQASAFDTSRLQPGDTRIDVIRRSMTQLRLAEYSASAIVMHPVDWEEIELTKDTTGQYVWANPRSPLGPTIWGLPVLDSTSLEPGEFLIGAFDVAAQLWDREDANVEISTEDQDNFIKNLVTIRAEERLALTVYRPESFIYGDFDETVSS
jgi:HK97 family phage major capsid protein